MVAICLGLNILKQEQAPDIGRRHFQMYFHEWKYVFSDLGFIEVYFQMSNWQWVQVEAWHYAVNKPVPKPMITRLTNAHLRHQPSTMHGLTAYRYRAI